LQPFAVEAHDFHENEQKLTGNTKNEQILNILIKYSCLAGGKKTT